MREETKRLEELRQKIEKVENESGSTSDYLDRGNPNPSQQKAALEAMKKLDEEAKALKTQLQALIANSPREALEEWVNFHAAILNRIIAEPVKDAHSRTRVFVAKQTLENWEKVRRGELDYVGINWHFLKDYKEEVSQTGEGKWWQFWK